MLDSVVSTLSRAEDYTVRLEVIVDIERMSIPPMEATLYYKRPDRMHIETDGIAMIPREVLPASLSAIPENFSVEGAETDTLRGSTIVRLSLEPRHPSNRTRHLSLAVDPRDWLPVELTTSMENGRTITADFTFVRVEGIWLPSEVTVQFGSAPTEATDLPSWGQTPTAGRTQSAPRRGTVKIYYRDYRVNTGLADELFETAHGVERPKEEQP
jgi:outer membrane lipoprotein-sorting protein